MSCFSHLHKTLQKAAMEPKLIKQYWENCLQSSSIRFCKLIQNCLILRLDTYSQLHFVYRERSGSVVECLTRD